MQTDALASRLAESEDQHHQLAPLALQLLSGLHASGIAGECAAEVRLEPGDGSAFVMRCVRRGREVVLTPAVVTIPGGWHEFDYDRRDETKPPDDKPVWIHDAYYHGVAIGFYDRGGWWVHLSGSDDLHVTHWAPLEPPPAPAMDDS